MKVAVISTPEMPCGKSTFCLLLGMLFAYTQNRTCSIVATDKMNHPLEMITSKRKKTVLNSVAVFDTVLQTGECKNTELYDYGLRIGNCECYLFDIYDSTYDRDQLDEVLCRVINRLKTDLMLIEVKGNVYSEHNQQVLEDADAILNLFTMSKKSMKCVLESQKKMRPQLVAKTGYVCAQYDPKVISEKELAKAVNTAKRNLLLFPYNPAITKEAIKGELDTVTPFLARGNSEVLNLRPKLVEVMEYLFNSPTVKYIKGVNTWYK